MTIEEVQAWGVLIGIVSTNIITIWTKVRTGIGIKALREALAKHTAKDEVKAKINSRLDVVTIEKIKYIKHLDQRYKDMLVSWSSKFRDFAISAFFSEYRKSQDVELYLEAKAGSLITDIEQMLTQRITERKGDIDIISFMKERSDVHKEVDMLVRTLVKNGLTTKDYIQLFEDYVFRILDEGIDLFQKWNDLK